MGNFCRQHGKKLASDVGPWGQHGEAVPGWTKVMALRATLGHQEDRIMLSFDGWNAFNCMFRSETFPAVSSVAPDLVG